MPDTTFYTVTMAKVQEEQGNIAKAIEIYEHLLEQAPDSESLRANLERLQQQSQRSMEDLVPLFREWFDLMEKYRKWKALQ